MFCEKCGTQNTDGARFCAGCGAVLEGAAPQAAPAPYAQPAAVPAPRRGLPVATRVLMIINAVFGILSFAVIFLPIRYTVESGRNFFRGQSAFTELIRAFGGRDKTKAILFLVLLAGTLAVLVAGVILSFLRRKASGALILGGCTYLACYCYAWLATSSLAHFTFIIYFMAVAAVGGIITSALVLSKYRRP